MFRPTITIEVFHAPSQRFAIGGRLRLQDFIGCFLIVEQLFERKLLRIN